MKWRFLETAAKVSAYSGARPTGTLSSYATMSSSSLSTPKCFHHVNNHSNVEWHVLATLPATSRFQNGSSDANPVLSLMSLVSINVVPLLSQRVALRVAARQKPGVVRFHGYEGRLALRHLYSIHENHPCHTTARGNACVRPLLVRPRWNACRHAPRHCGSRQPCPSAACPACCRPRYCHLVGRRRTG